MKTMSVLIFLLLSVSSCSGTSLLSRNSWKSIGSYLRPKDDKKMSLTDQTLSKTSAYENVKEIVCPENQEKWGFLKHLETEKIFVENDLKILSWDGPVMDADRFAEHHAEMKPFVGCLDHCFDLSAMFARAVQRQLFFLIESLVDASFEVNDDVKELLSPRKLIRAIEGNKQDLTRALIRLGTVNVKDNGGLIGGYTALHEATRENKVEVVRILIDKGADKEAKDNHGGTALHEAARSNRVEVVRILIEEGADKDAKDNLGATALHVATHWNYIEVVEILIEEGADKEAKDNNGYTALHEAAYRNHAEVTQFLIKEGADKDVKTNGGHTPLHFAAHMKDAKIAQILIEKGANKEAKDDIERTPLHEAAYRNNAEVARILIVKGANKEAKNQYGSTALHEAAYMNNAEVTRILIEEGADKNSKDNNGCTALYTANKEIARILIETEAKNSGISAIIQKIKFALKKPTLLISCFVIFIAIFLFLVKSN